MPKDTAGGILEAGGVAAMSPEELAGLPKKSDEPVLLAFVASWCEVSREAAPVVARVFKALDGRARVGRVDADASALDSERLGVRSVPAVVLFARGREIARFVGLAAEDELAAFCEKSLADVPPPEAKEDAAPARNGADADALSDGA